MNKKDKIKIIFTLKPHANGSYPDSHHPHSQNYPYGQSFPAQFSLTAAFFEMCYHLVFDWMIVHKRQFDLRH